MTSNSDALPRDCLPLGFDEAFELIDEGHEVGQSWLFNRNWMLVVGALAGSV